MNIQKFFLTVIVVTLVITVITATTAYCQQNARFQVALYFEDAAGNNDSLLIGFDANASNGFDPEFGEIMDDSPMNAVFDVRAVDPDNYSPFSQEPLYQSLVTQSTNGAPDANHCLTGGGAYIFIHAVHQPVRVWWDQSRFLDTICYRGAFLTNQITWELTEVSADDFPGITYCMAETPEGVFELTTEAFNEDPALTRLQIEHEIEGQGMESIYGLSMAVGTAVYLQDPCYWVTKTSDISLVSSISLYPNPCHDFLMLQGQGVEKLKQVLLFNNTGQQLEAHAFEVGRYFNFTHLRGGSYHLFGELNSGAVAYLGQFVKM
ncbi:T9SS type A sorting domain-containing protein [Phaeodactylibacter xiamenensis]|jgi:hypothetical protein|uniref:T9SS type A sorting domain-containing protein n=1 Tax=Phaeodactylibacter xiamenensis TaxID=1524460 RepID=UPI0024A9B4B5|nr:T9SS type A sorting domain-containing protein [Phaeodactylibacter xiamenensis]